MLLKQKRRILAFHSGDRRSRRFFGRLSPMPGRIELPRTAKRIRFFITAAASFDALLPVQGTWAGTVFDCFLEKTGYPRIEKLHEGIHVSAKGTPLFGIDLVNWQQQQTLGSDQAEQCKSGGVVRI